jgi:deoxycytidine triphosphate deaminase
MTNQPLNPLSSNDNEAQQKFDKYREIDPYPGIAPALLNSADIYDYVASTGMIFPFDPNPKNLKPASYEVAILGEFVYWDEEGKPQSGVLQNNDPFTLKKNSIAFVTLQPNFRLPDYIAIRFNLRITNVYKGLLLGTGPLVDPGFVGKLSIPLHNLTNNDYEFKGGDGLIWMEFTKLSPIPKWIQDVKENSGIPREGKFEPFRKPSMNVHGYLHKAADYSPIRSSIPEVILTAKQSAEEAQKSAEEAQKSAQESFIKAEQAVKTADEIQKNIIYRLTLGGIATAIATFLALYFTINALTQQVNSLVQDSVNYVKTSKPELEKSLNQSNDVTRKLEQENRKLDQRIKELNQKIGSQKK